MICKALALIKYHEGYEDKVYKCTADKRTFGYGTNLEEGLTIDEICFLIDNRDNIQAVAEHFLFNRMAQSIDDLEGFRFWEGLDENRQAAVVDFHYNVGSGTFRKFPKFIKALDERDFVRASHELFNSRWFTQVGRRAPLIRNLIRTGIFPQSINV